MISIVVGLHAIDLEPEADIGQARLRQSRCVTGGADHD